MAKTLGRVGELRKMQTTRLRNANPPKKQERAPKISLGYRGRDSVIDPDRPRRSGYALQAIQPREKTQQFSIHKLTLKDLYNLPVSQVLSRLIQSSSLMSRAVRIKLNHLVKSYTLESPENDDRAIEIIENFIERYEAKGKSFLGLMRQVGYGMEVEGAFCAELVFTPDGTEASKISYVSPFSLSFQLTEGAEGEYYLIGQKERNSNRLNVLQDEEDPNDTFVYDPTYQLGSDPFGSSELAPACFGVAAMVDLVSTIVDYIQGQVFPKQVYHLDVQALAAATDTADPWTKEELEEAANIASELIAGTLSAADITQDMVLSVPVVATLVGMMEKANIDGIEVLMDSFQTVSEQGTGVPRVLLGGRRARGGLNDNESDIELSDFDESQQGKQDQLGTNFSKLFTVILRSEGNTSHVNLIPKAGNPQIKRIEAEIFDVKMDGYTKLKNLNILHQESFKSKVLADSFDLSDLIEVEAKLDETDPIEDNPNPTQETEVIVNE